MAGRKNRHEGDTFADPLSADNEGYLNGAVHYVPIMLVNNIDRIKTRSWLVTNQNRQILPTYKLERGRDKLDEQGLTAEGIQAEGRRAEIRTLKASACIPSALQQPHFSCLLEFLELLFFSVKRRS